MTNIQYPIGTFLLENAGLTVAANGNLVVLDYDNWGGNVHGLQLVDISNSSSPVAVSRLDLDSSTMKLMWADDILYAMQLDRVSMVSVQNGTMTVENEWIVPAYPYGMAVANNVLYVSTELGVYVIDVENWEETAVLEVSKGIPGNLAIDGNRMYLCGQGLGLTTYDMSQPSAPVELGTTAFDLDFSPMISAKGTLVAVSLGGDGMMILDAQEPNNVQIEGVIPVEGHAGELIFDNDFAALGAGDAGVYQIRGVGIDDFSILSLCKTENYINGVSITNSLVIASGYEYGFSICERI
ncbi:MAG: hypothetical protein JXX29_06680 [Deltaproteobacteria bacterium]|nr:hypothetical protein [Deltaproteobacteria bacterium]MBN2671337.1 hypothetical protein [Deltaproteobacteria bacterium]